MSHDLDRPKPIGWTLAWAAVAMLCLVGAVYFYGRQNDYAHQMIRMREELRSRTIESTRDQAAFAILRGADTRQSAFGKGKVYVDSASGVLLLASGLDQGRAYAMWLIPVSGSPVAAGVFQPDASGAAVHVWNGRVDLATTRAVAVTMESQGVELQPAGAPVVTIPIAGT